MSAFMVSPHTMDRFLNGLAQYREHGWEGARIPDEWDPLQDPAIRQALSFGLLSEETVYTAVGRMLYDLNARAIQERYGEKADPPNYTFRRRDTSLLSAIKAGFCLRYQCAEGSVPEDPRYQWLERQLAELAQYAIRQLPEYATLPWDGPEAGIDGR